MERIPLIIDTDPGYDDALAIVFALGSSVFDLRAVTAAAGNISIERTYKNAVRILRYFNSDVPVGRGGGRPLTRELKDGSEIHSPSGLGGVDIPEDVPMPELKHSVDLIREVLESSERRVTIAPIGPLTNIALLLSIYPELKDNIDRIVLMGGAASGGNVTPSAEFNIYADPEAAKIVFESGLPVVMAGLDVTNGFQIYPEDFDSYRSMGKCGTFVAEALDAYYAFYKKLGSDFRGPAIHDMIPFAYLAAPELFEGRSGRVRVDCSRGSLRGRTAVDFSGSPRSADSFILTGCDREGVLDLFARSVKALG